MQVWTASFLDCPERVEVLLECIQSVHNLNLPHFVSVSRHQQEVQKLVDLTQEFPNLTLFIHRKRLRQFEHIVFILSKSTADKDSYLIFLDDDDVLVKLPTTTFSTKQYSTTKFEDTALYQKYYPYDPDTDSLSYDFSGTTCTKDQLQVFITHMKAYLKLPTLDMIFDCVYLNKPPDQNSPSVFKRKWNPWKYRNPWQEKCNVTMQEGLQHLKNLDKM